MEHLVYIYIYIYISVHWWEYFGQPYIPHSQSHPPSPCSLCFFLPKITVVDEGGVRVRLSITDTPGFGDQIDNSNWYMFNERCCMCVYVSVCVCPAQGIVAKQFSIFAWRSIYQILVTPALISMPSFFVLALRINTAGLWWKIIFWTSFITTLSTRWVDLHLFLPIYITFIYVYLYITLDTSSVSWHNEPYLIYSLYIYR